MVRMKYKLSLCRKKKRTSHTCIRKTTHKPTSNWINAMDEVLNSVKWTTNLSHVKSPFSTSKTKSKSSFPLMKVTPRKSPRSIKSNKRLLSVSKSVTKFPNPSKSPASKRVKTCLKYEREIEKKAEIENKDAVQYGADSLQNLEDVFPIDDDEFNDNGNMETLIDLLPKVLEVMGKNGLEDDFRSFFEMVADEKMPLHNMAFLLWMEVVRWFKCNKTTTTMRYSRETKLFWKTGYRLFGGRFISFMSGFKNCSQLLKKETNPGMFDPLCSDINFAVPDVKLLKSFNPYSLVLGEGVRQPGIARDVIEVLELNNEGKSFCVTFDGKKLKAGLKKDSGDVDLIGFESGKTLLEKKHDHSQLKDPLNHLIKETINKYENAQHVGEVRDSDKIKVAETLQKYLKIVSSNYLTIDELRKKREYAKSKMIEKSQGDWKNAKYVYAITAAIAYIHDADRFLKKTNEIINEIVTMMCSINERPHSTTSVNLYDCDQYVSIPESSEDPSINENTRIIKQRSETWYERRNKAKVTGSSLHAAVGLDGIKKQQEHYEKVVCKIDTPFSEEVKKFLQYGVDNEINANATFVNSVLPVLCPESFLCEEGFVEMRVGSDLDNVFIVVSPDGSIRATTNENSTIAGVELKCPVYDIHRKFPERYYLQCQAEIVALDVNYLYYLCWRPDLSSVFIINKDEEIFSESVLLAQKLYNNDQAKRPTKLLDESKDLKQKIIKKCNEEVEFIGLFPSVTHDSLALKRSESEHCRIIRLTHLLDEISEAIDDMHELQREKATEVIVFLACDLDREWESSALRSAPICWFTKGYSLNCETMSKILEEVLSQCKESGLHVPAISFDGQWHNLAVRNAKKEPLTVLQLQKDVWKKTEDLGRGQILAEFKGLNKTVSWRFVVNDVDNNTKVIVCTYKDGILPRISNRVKEHRIRIAKTNKDQNMIKPNVNSSEDKDLKQNEYERDQANQNFESHDNVIPHEDKTIEEHELEEDATIEGSSPTTIDLENFELEVQCETDDVTRTSTNILPDIENEQIRDAPIDIEDATNILRLIETDKNANNKGQWNQKTAKDIHEKFKTGDTLDQLRDVELKVIVRYLKKRKKISVNESERKSKKIEKLCSYYKIPHKTEKSVMKKTDRHRTYQIATLSELAYKVMNKHLKKGDLNIIHAEYKWKTEYESWRKCQMSHVFPKAKDDNVTNERDKSQLTEQEDENFGDQGKVDVNQITTDGHEVSTNCFWESELNNNYFYTGNYSNERQQCEVSCVDSSHLLTRTRRKICKGGLESMNTSAWKKVAKSKRTNLSIVMIESLLDPMSVPVAVSHISEEVECEMRNNGDFKEANFCRDMRLWWRAEDDPAISADDRIKMRMYLRNRLTKAYCPHHFPPPGMYINGWPLQLWEALISNIDSKILLYDMCKKKTYHTRAFSSMMGETFFSELTLLDRRGRGTVTVAEVGQFMESSIEKLHVRLDPRRTFTYRTTSKQHVYNLVEDLDEQPTEHDATPGDSSNTNEFINHPFDRKERRRLKPKKKEETVSSNRNAVQRGSLGVRFESARRNESKMYVTGRLGLELKDC